MWAFSSRFGLERLTAECRTDHSCRGAGQSAAGFGAPQSRWPPLPISRASHAMLCLRTGHAAPWLRG